MRTFEDFRGFGEEQATEPVVVIAPSPATATSHNSPMTPVALPAEIVKGLESRLKDEYTAHLIYRNAANWCKNANIQNESVAVFSDLLNALNLIDVNNRLDVLMFEDKYFG